jgi:poly-gamma-glutamate synthesis protein (capsule biosynthesis protein)
MAYAGTGMNLGEAREAAYLETAKGRAALISICSSFTGWARAGETRRDLKGRPGLNPLRFYYQADAEHLETVKELATKLGWWVTQVGQEWLLNPPGLHNTVYRLVESQEPGITPIAHEEDVDGNLRSIRNAKKQADYVLVHLHTHEWDPEEGLHKPAKFVPPFARSCIDAGADVFIGEGSHAPLRGIELYRNQPIFYDPGDLFTMSGTVTKLPSDSYFRPGYHAEVRQWEATPADNFDRRAALPKPLSPPGGYRTAPVSGGVVGVCSFGEGRGLVGIKLYPFTFAHEIRSKAGIPRLAEPETGRKIIDYLGKLSAPFGTRIEYKEGIGFVRL